MTVYMKFTCDRCGIVTEDRDKIYIISVIGPCPGYHGHLCEVCFDAFGEWIDP